jgi:hypothetical protein
MKTIRRRESPPPPSYQYQSGDFQMNLTNIKTASGKSFTVNAEAAPHFKAFVDELEGRGYKITTSAVSALAMRFTRTVKKR